MRNIAREMVNSHFQLAADIELYPSLGAITMFLEMVGRGEAYPVQDTEPARPRVFVLPIFEIAPGHQVPDNKTELVRLYRNKTVISFHGLYAGSWHRIPQLDVWLNTRCIYIYISYIN